jgi:hypothetical protein
VVSPFDKIESIETDMLLRPLLLVLLWVGGLAADAVNKDLVLTNVDRSVDLASQLVKINTKLTVSNAGQSPVKAFHFTLEESVVDKVAFIGATVITSTVFHFLDNKYGFEYDELALS